MMKTDSANAPSIPTRRRTPRGDFTVGPEDSGQTLSLAADIGALEECLTLERASGLHSRTSDGINSPPAVPYCEFLTLRSGDGRLQAVTRLMRLDGGNPFGNPLATDRFRISPLITALRYARAGVLEVGNPIAVPGCDPSEAARLLWNGIIGYLDRNGPGFVTGMESIPIAMELAHVWPRLMETHGLPPELEVETRSAWNPRSAMGTGAHLPGFPENRGAAAADSFAYRYWPAGLREALRRGCRLACEPAFNAAAGCLEFVWVASRDMLESGDSGGWRSAHKV
jgi:hypothetical protein